MSETALSPFLFSPSSSQPANNDYPQVSVALSIGSWLPGGKCSFVFLCNYLSFVTLKCVPVCLCPSTIKKTVQLPTAQSSNIQPADSPICLSFFYF